MNREEQSIHVGETEHRALLWQETIGRAFGKVVADPLSDFTAFLLAHDSHGLTLSPKGARKAARRAARGY
jgi:hypothetical protein